MPTISPGRSHGASFLLLLVGACAAPPSAAPRVAAAAPPVTVPQSRLVGPIIGQTARDLEAAFGKPGSVLSEGTSRRLQFAGTACVLDAYLYSERGREPVVAHVDTRRPTGEDIDRAACVAALRLGRTPS